MSNNNNENEAVRAHTRGLRPWEVVAIIGTVLGGGVMIVMSLVAAFMVQVLR